MLQASNVYYRDDSHPIPRVDVCDIEAERNDGGVDLVLVIASPMRDDEKSQQRLVKKVEYYLGYLASQTFVDRYGQSVSRKNRIIIRHHPECSPGAIELMIKCRGWIEDNRAELVVEPISDQAKDVKK
jgi:hypothetical protein